MGSNVFLLRNGETAWCEQGRLLGRRDIGLSAGGSAQARAARDALGEIELAEILCSPLASALETAEPFISSGVSLTRDPRLTNIDAGRWEGAAFDDLGPSDELARLLSSEDGGCETVEAVRRRVVSSVEQALTDNPDSSNILLVSHSAPIRIALAHYLGMEPELYHLFRLGPGAFCVLRFEDALNMTRIMAVNWAGSLTRVIAPLRGIS